MHHGQIVLSPAACLYFSGKLTNPAFAYEGEGFRRTTSNGSLNSMFGAEGDLHIRTCNECRMLLERRDQQMEQRNVTPVIVQLYNVSTHWLGDVPVHNSTFNKLSVLHVYVMTLGAVTKFGVPQT